MNPAMEIATDEKALRINLDAARYGTFAEVGAGQEVGEDAGQYDLLPPQQAFDV